ncbi:hypothetical protein [Streptomyces sp. Inha503]|uniref:hypothetical protein n=1 Tax=Streptomyces sp. Inha503 TaxID=3383314 RepID=UPI0039A10C1C
MAELVAIPSVNPREQAVAAETPLAGFVADYCRRLGMTARLDEVADGRRNVVATMPGRRTDEWLLLETHLDTVETEGMALDPFTAHVRDGRLYGRAPATRRGRWPSSSRRSPVSPPPGARPSARSCWQVSSTRSTATEA